MKQGYKKDTAKKAEEYGLNCLKRAESSGKAGIYDEAVHLLKEAIAYLPQKGFPYVKAASLLGKYLEQSGQSDQALTWNKIAARSAENSLESRLYKAHACLNSSIIYYRQGDYESSTGMADYGLLILEGSAEYENQAALYREKAKAEYARNQYRQALRFIDEALLLIRKTGNENLHGSILQSKGYILQESGDITGAVSQFEKAGNYFKKTGDSTNYGLLCIDIGFLYYQINNFDAALKVYKEGLQFSKTAFTTAQLYDNLGAVYWKKKDFDTALKYYQKALINNTFYGFSNPSVFQNPSAGDLASADFKNTIYIILTDKAICWLDYYKATGHTIYLKYCLDTYHAADHLLDFMRWEQPGLQNKYYWRDRSAELYQHAIEAAWLAKNVQEAFYFMEKSKAVVLRDYINENVATGQLEPEALKKETSLNNEINQLQKAAGKSPVNKPGIQKALLQKKILEKEEFVNSLKQENPLYFKLKYNNEIPTLSHFLEFLDHQNKGTSFLSLFETEDTIYRLWISQGQVHFTRIFASTQKLNYFLQRLSEPIISQKDYQHLLLQSHFYYKLFFHGIDPLKTRHLVIATDKSFVPFELLIQNHNNTDYLVQKFPVSYIYSATIAYREKEPVKSQSEYEFAGLSPVLFSNYPALRGSEQSLATIGKNFTTVKLITEKAATSGELSQRLRDTEIVHLFTHSEYDSLSGQSTLLLADGPFQNQLVTNPGESLSNLVFLAACKTGTGKLIKGEGLLSQARTFYVGGVPNVIATIWDVPDKPVYEIAENFYSECQRASSYSEALQKAKLTYITNHPHASPYEWAGIILTGSISDIPKKTSPFMIAVWSVIGFLLISVIYYGFNVNTFHF